MRILHFAETIIKVWPTLLANSIFKKNKKTIYFSVEIQLKALTIDKAKGRHLKKLPIMGLRDKCLSEFIDWRYS